MPTPRELLQDSRDNASQAGQARTNSIAGSRPSRDARLASGEDQVRDGVALPRRRRRRHASTPVPRADEGAIATNMPATSLDISLDDEPLSARSPPGRSPMMYSRRRRPHRYSSATGSQLDSPPIDLNSDDQADAQGSPRFRNNRGGSRHGVTAQHPRLVDRSVSGRFQPPFESRNQNQSPPTFQSQNQYQNQPRSQFQNQSQPSRSTSTRPVSLFEMDEKKRERDHACRILDDSAWVAEEAKKQEKTHAVIRYELERIIRGEPAHTSDDEIVIDVIGVDFEDRFGTPGKGKGKGTKKSRASGQQQSPGSKKQANGSQKASKTV